jgi:hypothetical protein
MTLMFIAAWPLWHLFPPPAANMSAEAFAAFFLEHHTGMLVGSIVQMFACSLVYVWVGALTTMLREVEGKHTPLTDTFIMIWTAGMVTLICALIYFLSAAYRPDASPQLVRAMSDMGIFMFVFPGAMGIVQWGIPGFIILGDKRAQPVFPRWLGYLGLWVAALSVPAVMIAMFQTGPFSWNGIIGFWLPVAAFGVAVSCFTWAMLRGSTHPAFADM